MNEEYEFEREYQADQRKIHRGKSRHQCPTCGKPNAITDEQKHRGYHCDACTRETEGGGFFP